MRKAVAILFVLGICCLAGACAKKEPEEKQPADAGATKKKEPPKNPWAHISPSTVGRHEGSALHVAWSPDGSLLLSTGNDKQIRLWNPSTGEQVRTFAGHKDKVFMADFSPDGKLLVSASADKTARIWDRASGKCLKVLEDQPPKKMTEEEELAYAKLPPAQMNWAAFSPDGKKVITASDDFALKLWYVKTGTKYLVFQDAGCRQRRVYRRADASGWLSSAGCMDDGVAYLKFWDDNGNLKGVRGDEQHDAHYLAFDRGGKFIVAADGSLSFTVFSAQGSQLKRITVGGYHFCLAFGPDDKTLLVGTDRGEIFVYRPASWKREGKIDVGEKVAVECMALNPSDQSLAVALRSGKVLRLTTPIK
jgi:WD40 repeat protein